MQIETRRFGHIEVDSTDTYEVPNGIPGFPSMRTVVLLAAGDAPGAGSGDTSEGHSLFWMQDMHDGDLAFLCVVPWSVFPDYDIDVDERTLGIADPADIRVLALVTTRREDGAAHMTANLRAPLVVDAGRRRLQQVILSDSRWPIRAPFAELVSPRDRAGEPAGAADRDVAGSVQ